jgi:hypothetical protein
MGSDLDSILARGGTLRVTTPLGYRVGSVVVPLALALIGARAIGDRAYVPWLVLVAAVAAVVAFALSSRSFVAVVGSTLRWRLWGRTHEASLAEVDLPVRARVLTDDRLSVMVRGRKAFSMYGRVWGPAALDDVEARLRYNARVARPRARASNDVET